MNELISRFRGVLGRMSRRERRLALLMVGVAVLFVAFLSVMSIRGALADRRSRIETKKAGLQRVLAMSEGFREARAEQERLEAELRRSKGVSLFSFLEETSRKAGVSITKMTPRTPTTHGKVTEEVVDVAVDGVTLDKLTDFINRIQRSPHVVKILTLRIRRKRTAKEEVDAKLTVATYSLVG
ncbi:MAG: hypothetical protein D6729_06015 [Deltaproteobacteria bacterium]|nr:MAG: hypothetical protein D6729_06015 [Deltaproteobacteria bacterium]